MALNKTLALSVVLMAVLCSTVSAQEREVVIMGETERLEPSALLLAQLQSIDESSAVYPVVRNWITEQGYIEAVIDSVSVQPDTTTVYLTEGCLYRVEAVSVRIDERFDGDRRLPLVSESRFLGEPLTRDLIREISAEWLSAFEDEGFLLSEFKIESIIKETESCTIEFNGLVTPGVEVEVEGVRFEGVVRNSESYLQRVSGIREGERITPGLIERGRRNLINSGLFDEVSDGELIFVNSEPFVLYTVVEQQLNFFDGLIGYVPDATGSGNIAGYGDILLRNTIADGNVLDLRYEQLQPLVSKLSVQAEQNYPGGLPVRIGGGLNFTQQDSSYLVRNMELRGGYFLFTGFELIGTVRAERSSVSEGVGQFEALNTRANFYGLGFHVRNTDRFRVPTRGYEGRLMLETGRRFINDDRFTGDENRSFSQSLLRANVRGYIPRPPPGSGTAGPGDVS